MEIYFKTKKLAKVFSNPKEMVKEFGIQLSKKINQRLMEIKATNTLQDLHKLPAARCHQLKHDRDNQFAVDVKQPYRLIFEPYHDPVPLKSDGGFDLSMITSILIIEVVDYHGD